MKWYMWLARFALLLLALVLLSGCGLDVQHELLGDGSLRMEDALRGHVRAQEPGSANIVLISSQPWRQSQAILFRYETTGAHGQPVHHLGVAFAERSGLAGWLVRRSYTAVRYPAAMAHPLETYVGTGLLPGSLRMYTRVGGHVNIGNAQRVLISYGDGDDIAVDLVDGYFLDLHEGRTPVPSIVALDADGKPIGKPVIR